MIALFRIVDNPIYEMQGMFCNGDQGALCCTGIRYSKSFKWYTALIFTAVFTLSCSLFSRLLRNILISPC